jgi:uncharacterized protein (UPF0276 family)
MDRGVHPLPNGAVHSAGPIPARAGIGLRFPHHEHVLMTPRAAAWLEVHPENYLGEGAAAETLMAVRRDYTVSLHATGLSLGSADGVDREHLAAIAELAARLEPGLISDHLSWSAMEGLYLPDLLPLPYTYEALDLFACNIETVQDVLRRPILIENPSVYLAFAQNEMDEAQFLAALTARTGCGLLLDVNNIAVAAANLGEDAVARLDAVLEQVPPAAIGEIHLAGHAVKALPDGGALRIDDHGAPVSDEVWGLFARAIRQIGPRPALIEWDTAIPDFAVLAGEAAMADALMQPQVRHAATG